MTSPAAPGTGPLDGIRVLDLTSVVLGPIATQVLADFGADVIKVETPEGDRMRTNGVTVKAGLGSIFLALNRNKRSVKLDLKQPEGREALRALLASADVLVHNMRVQAIERLGFGYEAVRALNPRIVYCVGTGFGQDGPHRDKPAFDDIIREAAGQGLHLTREEERRLDGIARDLGLWGLDAPADVGGSDLPAVAMVGVHEELGRTITPYRFPPDSPNLRMLLKAASPAQRARYLGPYTNGDTVSAIAISEPGGGADPANMKTRAVRDGDEWLLNGRKIWISRAADADWTIVMAVTDREKGARGGISAFIVDRGTEGYRVGRRIAMIGGLSTYEVALDDCRVPATQMLGAEGHGFAPMQTRLSTRKLQMAAWCIARTQRALDMLVEYAPQRSTFGTPLSERQAVQWWITEAATKLHACRLMLADAAERVDRGDEARQEIAMLKVFSTEMAWETLDHVMQAFGAMGMTKEMPLQQMANDARLARIYEGPSEVHRWTVARDLIKRGRAGRRQ